MAFTIANTNATMPGAPGPRPGASGPRPRNVDYYLQRMAGYSKNTISIQPQTKAQYNLGDTIVFRLPTNSILDLHTLTLKCAGQIIYCGSNTAGVYVQFPRFTQSMFRRKDWTMGGMQTGCGSLHDYGAPYSLLGAHKIPINRFSADLDVTDNANCINFTPLATCSSPPSFFVLKPATIAFPTQNVTPWQPFSVTSWLGVASGTFMRFLDTDIMHDIEIRMMLAPRHHHS